MRPRSIILFERVVLISILLSIPSFWLSFLEAPEQASAEGVGTGALIAANVLGTAIYLLLLWLISRRASSVARSIYVILTVVGLVIGLYGLRNIDRSSGLMLALTVAQFLLSLISLWLLFRPEARSWFPSGSADSDRQDSK